MKTPEQVLQELESLSRGEVVWRVGTSDQSYCLEFSRRDSARPERDCQDWLKEQQEKQRYLDYHVYQATRYTQKDLAMQEAARVIRELSK